MTNCEWLNSKLEAYFCDDLTGDELKRFQGHLGSCAECHQQVQSLKQIDPLVRGVLQHRLAIAQMAAHANGRPRVFKLAVAAAGMVAVAVVLMVFGPRSTLETPAPPVAVQPPEIQNPIEPDGIKKDSAQEQDVKLGKPGDGTPVQPAPQPYLDKALVNGPEFSIMDSAGISANLEAYRGRVVLFGVVSPDQKAAVSNLDQIYEALGSNGRIRIFGVASHRTDQFRGTQFPLFFNNGSQLLGAGEGDFRLVDSAGKVKLEGSLADPSSVSRIRSELSQLGIR
jgi:hypothetical protein